MTPRAYQTIGAYLDIALFLGFGVLALSIPGKLIAGKGTDEEKRKRIKTMRICGVVLLVVSIVQLLIKIW